MVSLNFSFKISGLIPFRNKSKTTNDSFTVFYEDYEELKRVPQQFHFEIDTTSDIDLLFTKTSSSEPDDDHSYPSIILEKYT